jgi:putative chitinase
MRIQIKRGDTLSELAQKHGTTVQALANANGIANPDLIYAGASLKIVGAGDSFEVGGSSGSAGSSRSRRVGSARPGEVSAPSNYVPGKSDVTAAQLMRIMPGLSSGTAQDYLPHLNRAMADAGIVGKERQAAFLAQLGHESGGLRYMEEIASGAAYEGRSDLGNVRPGDGVRYKGRGPIQLTGRANYRAAGAALGIDLEGNPELAKQPHVAFRIATWYWNSRGLNALADSGSFNEITQRINGGYNGLSDRLAYWARAKAAL